MSERDDALACTDSPCCARSLLTVRAAISSATCFPLPRLSRLSLICAYWRSRFALHDFFGMIFPSSDVGQTTLAQQIAHVVGMFLFHRHDAREDQNGGG